MWVRDLAERLLDEPLYDWKLTHGGLIVAMDTAYREAGSAPVDGFSFPIVKAELATNDESLFIDLCHLNEEGNRRIGEALAETFLPFVLEASSKLREAKNEGN